MNDMRRYLPALPIVVMLVSAASPSQAQPPANLVPLKVESPVGDRVVIDGAVYISGEIVELTRARHTVRINGPYESTLQIELEVSNSGDVSIASSSIGVGCASFDQPDLRVSEWKASVFRNSKSAILAVHGPTIAPRTTPLPQCVPPPSPCCGWASTRHVTIRFDSSPVSATILADGKDFVTGTTLSIPYGVDSDGRTIESKTVSVYRENYIGCRYALKDLIAFSNRTVQCTLRQP